MTNTKSLTASERSARALLAAWNSGELARLEAALLETARAQASPMPSSEGERIEMVREIEGTIRGWLAGANPAAQADLRVSLKLLRHLARCEDVGDAEGIAAPKQVPQSETLAFARR